MLLLTQFILLVLCANGAPVLAQRLFVSSKISRSIDNGKLFIDNKPVLGATKTWRGVIASILLTSICALVLGMSLQEGFIIAILAMSGDLTSSFIKRRLNIPSSSMAVGLDQIPESLLPFAYGYFKYQIPVYHLLLGISIFLALELLLSGILYNMRARKKPF